MKFNERYSLDSSKSLLPHRLMRFIFATQKYANFYNRSFSTCWKQFKRVPPNYKFKDYTRSLIKYLEGGRWKVEHVVEMRLPEKMEVETGTCL